jgi:hypothetical protein
MPAIRSPGRALRESVDGGIGWLLTTMVVVAAVPGPPLSNQSIPTLLDLRHDILTLHHEFERTFLRPDASRDEMPLVQIDYLRPEETGSRLASEDVE